MHFPSHFFSHLPGIFNSPNPGDFWDHLILQAMCIGLLQQILTDWAA